ncbi:hypothetical protein RhiirA5_415794 [Rhizophagus irregularis]|uniref:DUF8206 domain-containing protein n=1 Tax=Rhizophagus irregularis TaxID=588596 RepID=A0A2N0PR60_9GLOM|nr:hypothetical protein RhiirA5_415794 [Rhizophagus irregularis]
MYTVSEEQSFAESWKKSVDESMRLIKYLVKPQPHVVEDTISLNNSRNTVILISKPLAEMEHLIQQNIILIKEKQEEIKNSDETIEELDKKLYVSQIDLKPVKLRYPRTVRTDTKCIQIIRTKNIKKINYVRVCCSHCYLKFSRHNVIYNKILMLCSAIKKSNGKFNDVMDRKVELLISAKRSDQEKKKAIIEVHQRMDNQLREEQEKIKEISLKFAQFLRQNAIAAYNDAYADYLDLHIKEEKTKRDANPSHYDDRVLKGLETTKDNYLNQVETIKQAIEINDGSNPPITPEEIAELEQQLYNLPINGQTLKSLKFEAQRSQTDVFRQAENHYKSPSTSDGINFKSNPLARFFGKGLL